MSVLVVGALHLDVVVRAPRLPRLDETLTGSGVTYVCGGKGGNQARAAARCGARVHFAGRVGRDAFGETLRAGLVAAGVDVSQLQEDAGPSGMSAAIVDDRGDYGAVIVSAANLDIDAESIRIPGGTAVVLLQNEVPEPVNIAVARRARAAGAQVWLNAAPVRALSQALTGLVDLLIVNRVEAEAVAGVAGGIPVLETRGAEGVRFGGRHWPAREVPVISSHGAGDIFVGALAAQVAVGAPIEQAIGFAQAAAAWHVSTPPHERDAARPADLVHLLPSQPRP